MSEEDPTVVKVEMYAAFNSDTDYYFTFGDAEPVKFHTAKNDIKYAKTLKLVEATAYYVGQDTPIEYKFLDENGVELAISDLPAFEITSDYAYGIGTNIYFHAEGTATIKASIVTGYDEETNKAITLTDTLTVTGVKKTTTQTGKVYSFSNNVDDAKHTIRIGDPNSKLLVKYTLSDGNKTTIDSTTGSYYLKSTDETVAMIGTGTNVVYGVNAGSATIVLYDGDNTVLDAFPITVLDANKVGSATAELSKTTLNRDGGVTDDITLTVVGYDLDGSKDSTYAQNYTVTVQQLENNDVATKVTINGRNAYTIAHAGSSTATLNLNDNTLAIVDSRTDKTQFATIRLVVTVKNASGTKVLEKTLSFVVSEQDTPNAYKLTATKNALDTSIKNWGYTDLSTKTSVIGVNAVKTTSYGDFFISNETFDVISSVNNIPATDTAGTVGNFVIRSFPTTNGVDPVAAALDNGTVDTLAQATNNVTVTAFPSTTTRCQTGSYTFTGYHVEYGADTKGVRTSLGTQTVMVSRSDVAATAAIKDGKASTFNANYSADANIENIFKVTWEGLNSDDNNGRVNITSCNSPTYDTQSEAWYCRKITVSFVLDTDANGDPGNYTFTQNININKLFKND